MSLEAKEKNVQNNNVQQRDESEQLEIKIEELVAQTSVHFI